MSMEPETTYIQSPEDTQPLWEQYRDYIEAKSLLQRTQSTPDGEESFTNSLQAMKQTKARQFVDAFNSTVAHHVGAAKAAVAADYEAQITTLQEQLQAAQQQEEVLDFDDGEQGVEPQPQEPAQSQSDEPVSQQVAAEDTAWKETVIAVVVMSCFSTALWRALALALFDAMEATLGQRSMELIVSMIHGLSSSFLPRQRAHESREVLAGRVSGVRSALQPSNSSVLAEVVQALDELVQTSQGRAVLSWGHGAHEALAERSIFSHTKNNLLSMAAFLQSRPSSEMFRLLRDEVPALNLGAVTGMAVTCQRQKIAEIVKEELKYVQSANNNNGRDRKRGR